MLSHAEILSRAKIRTRHLATDHDCVLSKFEMSMRQQPVQARMCGVGEKCESDISVPPYTQSESRISLWALRHVPCPRASQHDG